MCAVPAASPLVSAAPLSSTSLMVTWSPPSTITWKGTIQKLFLLYGLVVYNETEDTMEQQMTIAVSPLAQPNEIAGTVNVTGLTAFTEYYVSMSLVNDAGEGPYSDKTSTMTLQGSEFILSTYMYAYTYMVANCNKTVQDNGTLYICCQLRLPSTAAGLYTYVSYTTPMPALSTLLCLFKAK